METGPGTDSGVRVVEILLPERQREVKIEGRGVKNKKTGGKRKEKI